MMDDLELNMNAYLPLRDVVFSTLREAKDNRDGNISDKELKQLEALEKKEGKSKLNDN